MNNKREYLKSIAQETLNILKENKYKHKIIGKQELNINNTINKTQLIKEVKHKRISQYEWFNVKENVVKKGTIDTSIELKKNNPEKAVAILNFASAQNPGGGFLNGSIAQEESIARSTTLYSSLLKYKDEFYLHHRNQDNSLYSDRMIYTHDAEIFRNDNCELLEKPLAIDIITSSAPNAGIAKTRGISEDDINKVLKNRIFNIVQLAVDKNIKILILGAFGCGVFKNNSENVSKYFNEAINQLVPKNSMIIKFAIIGKSQRGF